MSKDDKPLKLPTTRNFPKRGGRLIEWVDGKPMPVYRPPISKEQFGDLIGAALASEYMGDLDPDTGEPMGTFDPRFTGMTNAEVIAFRLAEGAARGNIKMIEQVLDRQLGKPKQSMESVNVAMSYQDYLDNVAEDEDFKSNSVVVTFEEPKFDELAFLEDDDDDFDDEAFFGV